jgi:outer membrane protein insertion porin family
MRLPPLTASRASRGLRHAVALALLAGSGAPLWSTGAAAQDAISADAEFTVADLKVEGLQRIAEGTVFNYLPVAIGDRLTRAKTDEALRALYATGFFRNVELRREGDALVVVVQERPSIESFTIDGNKDIKTEDLQKSLRNVGLATGKTFDRSVLEDVTGYLTDQYFGRARDFKATLFSSPHELKQGTIVQVLVHNTSSHSLFGTLVLDAPAEALACP